MIVEPAAVAISKPWMDRGAAGSSVGWRWAAEAGASDGDSLGEFAGRACYESWGRPNPATTSAAAYLARIVEQEHFSVLEHASVVFYVTGVSRALTHELIRHRHLSFSQRSQRFVDESRTDWVAPPILLEERLDDERWETERERLLHELEKHAARARWLYSQISDSLSLQGTPRKQAREAARSALVNATETRLVVSGNLRAWREFLEKRLADGADAEIRRFALEILRQLRDIAPGIFADLAARHLVAGGFVDLPDSADS